MCQVNLLESHSTTVSCIKNGKGIDCYQSVEPNTNVEIKCKSRYHLEKNAKTTFVCQESGNWDGKKTECKADCGQLVQKAKSLISEGKEANPHEVPWHAVIYNIENQICGGTIISGLFLNFYSICFLFQDFICISRINCFISSSLF